MTLVLARLDTVRASLLRFTLSFDFAREVFVSRANRLLVSFLFSCALSFALAVVAPVWMIALAPLLLGIPHLFAGFRYIPKLSGLNGRQWVWFFTAASFGVSILRLTGVSTPIPLSNEWEVLALVLVLGAFSFALPRRVFLSAALLLGVFAGSWFYPLWTLSILAFAHHFVAFMFWLRSAKSLQERRTVWVSLGIFTAATTYILAGGVDSIAPWMALPSGWGFDPDFLIRGIFPAASQADFVWGGRLISAYAFGQSLHYFVWLKAIPEQDALQSVPLSFVQSGREIQKDLGPGVARAAVAMSVGLVGMMAWWNLEYLRDLYISLSTAHGYLELASLPFLVGMSRARA
ncbi:hypothetical protein K2X30_06660 [bacterium]|jgi:hypothetical protein|nr:hypothetical protein [bacterium]